MSRKAKSILLAIGGLVTVLIAYVTVRFWTSDEASTILPGWRTTIYLHKIYWIMLAIIILLNSVVGYLLFRGAIKLLALLWTKLKS